MTSRSKKPSAQTTDAPAEKSQPQTARSREGRELFIVTVPAMTPDGTLLAGEIAEAGAKILKDYPLQFKPLEITYRA